MENVQKNITKICSFYVSEWHLTTMLLPYLDKEIKNKNKISTILEKDLEENIKKLVERVGMDTKEEILNINWKRTSNLKNEKIQQIMNNLNIIIINGTKNYIKNANKAIEEYIKINNIESKIKILNCYKVTNLTTDLDDILKLHDKVLNTTGEKNIEEVFEGYKRMDII